MVFSLSSAYCGHCPCGLALLTALQWCGNSAFGTTRDSNSFCSICWSMSFNQLTAHTVAESSSQQWYCWAGKLHYSPDHAGGTVRQSDHDSVIILDKLLKGLSEVQVILKPAEATPLTALALAELGRRAGLPPGVLNIVVGEAKKIGVHCNRLMYVQSLVVITCLSCCTCTCSCTCTCTSTGTCRPQKPI